MTDDSVPPTHLRIGGAVLVLVGLLMTVEGIQHTISGEPIPASTWTEESSGPEQTVFGVAGIGLGLVAFRIARRGGHRQ